MGAHARYCVTSILLVLLVGKSEEKCAVVAKTESHCNSVADLQQKQANLQKKVTICEVSDLQEFKLVPVENANNIEKLELRHAANKISKDAFRNFTNLQSLHFMFNQIGTIEPGIFENLNLKNLDFYESEVKAIAPGAFLNLSKLEVLRLANNNLTEVTKNVFNNLTLHTLTFSNNEISRIEKLSFSDMPNLKRLYLDNNRLTTFNIQDYVSDVSKIERLWLQKNNFTEITNYMLEGLQNLKVLNLGYNHISSIEPRSFAETPKLTTLVLTNNFLKVIDGSVLSTNGLPELKILYLDHNRLMFLSSNFLFRLNVLKFVSLGGNPWHCPCLDLVLRWLADNNVKLSCDKDYFGGDRPVCVAAPTGNSCVYAYDDKSYDLFQSVNSMYPPAPFCVL